MPWEAWFTLAVVVILVGLLATDRVSPPTGFVGAVVILLLAGIVTPEEAFSGFSEAAPITVAALFVLAAAIEETGALSTVTSALFGKGGSMRGDLTRITIPTSIASSFLNNTPIVTVLSREIVDWSRRTNRSPSRYLLPMNSAAVLGGMVTLIGTSTNILVSGLMERAGLAPMGFFEITEVGLPLAVGGVFLLILLAPKLIPERQSARERLSAEAKEFTLEMIVEKGSPLAQRSVADAGLRDLSGVFLVEIERDGHKIAPVSPNEGLREGDRLTFAGNVANILDLQRVKGLVSAERPHFAVGATRGLGPKFFEAVLSGNSSLVGTTLKKARFRGRYGGAVVAVHRHGERVPSKLGEVELQPADVLLVLGDPEFEKRWKDQGDFLVIAPLDQRIPLKQSKAPLAGLTALGVIVVAGSGLLPILQASLGAAVLLIAFRVLTPRQARDSVDLNVLLTIGASFGMGAAILGSGLADEIARILLTAISVLGPAGIIVAVLAATIAMTELLTNNAAAALMFPIAMAVAEQGQVDPRSIAIAVAVGASAGFLTPIGYQTNMIVYGLGGYKFSDFTRIGIPLTLLTLVVGEILLR